MCTSFLKCKNGDKLTCRAVVKINEMWATKHHTVNVQKCSKNVSYYFNKIIKIIINIVVYT